MKEKKEKKAVKMTARVDDIVAAYNILNTRKREYENNTVHGFNLSGQETSDMFRVLYIMKALKPVAVAFEDFRKDALERLKPEAWEEVMEKYRNLKKLSDEDKAATNEILSEYNKKVAECVKAELDKEKELEAYERLGKEAFGVLVKDNGHILDSPDILVLQELIA